jgi:hypothetical protein
MTPTLKRVWSRPELIVLVRNRPEESVLGGCKNHGEGTFSGPSNQDSQCSQDGLLCNYCENDAGS